MRIGKNPWIILLCLLGGMLVFGQPLFPGEPSDNGTGTLHYVVAESIYVESENASPTISVWSMAVYDEDSDVYRRPPGEETFDTLEIGEEAMVSNLVEGNLEESEVFHFISDPFSFELWANCDVKVTFDVPGALVNPDGEQQIQVLQVQFWKLVYNREWNYYEKPTHVHVNNFPGGLPGSFFVIGKDSEHSEFRLEFVLRYENPIWMFENGAYAASMQITLESQGVSPY